MEHAYIKWIRGKVVKTDEAGCCALVSRVSGGKSSENLLLTAEISFEKLMESCDEAFSNNVPDQKSADQKKCDKKT